MRILPAAIAIVALATPSVAQTPRDLLVQAGYQARSKADALAKVNAALRSADAGLSQAQLRSRTTAPETSASSRRTMRDPVTRRCPSQMAPKTGRPM